MEQVTKVEKHYSTNFFGMLAVLFIGLKLTGYINWSWWWVLSPLWMPIVIILTIAIIINIIRMILR